MATWWRPVVVLLLCLTEAWPATDVEEFRVVYEWFKLDYTWPDDSTKAQALSNNFVQENNVLAGIKVWRDRVFLTVPRWKEGVPSSLNSVPATPRNNDASPKLQPFPSWEMQELGNCSALQNVQSMEIDPLGRMWVVDVGRVNLFARPNNTCPPKLLLIDLSNNRILRTFVFPEEAASQNRSFLNDIVVDGSAGAQSDNWFAYITDAFEAAIVVYSLRENRAWKVTDRSMQADPEVRELNVNGESVAVNLQIDGIALSPLRDGARTLYYSPVASYNLFSIPTDILKDPAASRGVAASVTDLGRKQSPSDGLAMDNTGMLYYGLVGRNSIARWDTSQPFTQDNQIEISQDDALLQWPDTFGFDSEGYLWVISNRLHKVINNRVNLNEPNYRVIRGFTGTKSYMYPDESRSMGTSTKEPGRGYVEEEDEHDHHHEHSTTVSTTSQQGSAGVALQPTAMLFVLLQLAVRTAWCWRS